MKTLRWIGLLVATVAATIPLRAQGADIYLPRPGSVAATNVIGEVKVLAGGQARLLKAEERIRVGATVTTGRRSLVVLELSNGATLQVGSDSEIEIEEFGQEAFSTSTKLGELKEEPTISRTRLKLVRGDLEGTVKRLKTARGSSFLVTTTAGTLKIVEGSFRAMLRMTDLGLGACTIDLPTGVAEFEPVGGSFTRVPAGRRLGFAIEMDKVSGAIRLSELPTPSDAPKASSIVRPTPAPKAPEAVPTAPPTKRK